MSFPGQTIRIATNQANKWDHAINLAGDLLTGGLSYHVFSRVNFSFASSLLLSAGLAITDLISKYGIGYLLDSKKISYNSAITLSQISYLFSKVVIIATAIFGNLISAPVGIIAIIPLIIFSMREAENTRFFHVLPFPQLPSLPSLSRRPRFPDEPTFDRVLNSFDSVFNSLREN